MTYPEELARVRANLERLRTFGDAHPWLTEGLYCALYPESNPPRFVLVCGPAGFPVAKRPRLVTVSKIWRSTMNAGSTTKRDWETIVDGVEVQILTAEDAPKPVPFDPDPVAREEVAS